MEEGNRMDRYDPYTDKFLRDTQYNIHGTNLASLGTDCISRQAAIAALENDMASLDHIIKGMSANDVRLDAYVSQRNQVNYDIYTINNLPPAQPEQLGTNLAEVGTDCISRQAAISAICNACGKIDCDKMDKCEKLQLSPANISETPNSSDTISRQQAIDALCDMPCKYDEDGYALIYRCDAADRINVLPAIQPKRIRGQWSIKGQAIDTVRGYWAKCSACGHSVFGGGNYCSYCGSYNKGEVEQ